MSRECLVVPPTESARAIVHVLNVLGPPRFRVAAPTDASTAVGSPVDLLLLTNVSASEVREQWRFTCSVHGDLSAVDLSHPISRLAKSAAGRDEGLQPLPETANLLASVWHSIFKNEYLLEGAPGLEHLAAEYPRWLAALRACASTETSDGIRLLERVGHVAELARARPDRHRSTLVDLVGHVDVRIRAIAAKHEERMR